MRQTKVIASTTDRVYFKVVATFAFIFAAAFFGIGVGSQSEKRNDDNTLTERKEANREYDHDQDEVEELLRILENPENKTRSPKLVTETLQKLGAIRDQRAIPALVHYLDYEPKFADRQSEGLLRDSVEITQWDYLSISSRYPAIGSLFQMGKPALPALVKTIEDKESMSIPSRNAIATIQLIFREELPKAVEYLESATEGAATPIGKQRLQSAISETRILCSKVRKSGPEQ